MPRIRSSQYGDESTRCSGSNRLDPPSAFSAYTAGVHYVVPDFAWVQDVGGSLMVLADQVRRAIAWVYRNAVRFGIDPTRLAQCINNPLGY